MRPYGTPGALITAWILATVAANPSCGKWQALRAFRVAGMSCGNTRFEVLWADALDAVADVPEYIEWG